MNVIPSSARGLALGLAGLALAQVAHAESDARRIISAKPCTLATLAANGTIEVKIPTATAVLATLSQPGDSFLLDGGKEYVLVFKESKDGLFRFDLKFSPTGSASAWSCRVQTLATPPFIGVRNASWSGAPGKVTINTDRTKSFISIN
jgi:hypothetical protein